MSLLVSFLGNSVKNRAVTQASLGLQHVFYPAVFAHVQTSLGLLRLEHPVIAELFTYHLQHGLGGKGLAANNAAQGLLLVQHPHLVTGIVVKNKPRMTGDGIFRAGFFTQTALDAIPLHEFQLG